MKETQLEVNEVRKNKDNYFVELVSKSEAITLTLRLKNDIPIEEPLLTLGSLFDLVLYRTEEEAQEEVPA